MCTQKGAFITESVLRLIGGEGQSQRGGLHDGDGRSANGATEGESGENLAAGRAYTPCNPLVWQVSNAGLVDHKVSSQVATERLSDCIMTRAVFAVL